MKSVFSSYRNKKILIIAAMVIITVFVYLNNVSKTISMFNEYKMMEEKLTDSDNLTEQVMLLEKTTLDKNKNKKNNIDSLPQSRLLDIITQACSGYHLTLYKFGSPVVYVQQKYNIQLNMIAFQGSFINLTRCINRLETLETLKGQIMSVEYKQVKTYGGKGNRLVATIYFQQASKESANEK